MPKPGKQAEEQVKRMSDFVKSGSQLEGERVDFDDILGEDVKMLDFVILKGDVKYGPNAEFVVVQFEREGKVCTTSTGGKVIVDALKQMPKNYLPVMIKFIKPKGKKYYAFE